MGRGQCFNKTSVYAPPGTLFVAVGDFNGDGRADLVASNVGDNTLKVRLGNGSGGFGDATSFSAGQQPITIAVGDLNGDGRADVVMGNSRSTNITVLLGNGSGGFGAATDIPIGKFVSSLVLGDFNSDGKVDLATADIASSNTVSVLFGTGSGGFGPVTSYAVGDNPRSVTLGDFNGDGKVDLATANYLSNNVSVLLGTSSGGFGTATNFPVGINPNSIVVSDFNGDGRQDLATTNGGTNTVSVLLGTGTGGFGAAIDFSVDTSPNSIAVGDFNGDGKVDLAITIVRSNNDTLPDNVTVLLGNGSGGFGGATNFPVGRYPNPIAVGDFNGDNRPDLVTPNFGNSELAIFINCAPPAGFAISGVTPVHCTTVTATERQFTFTPQYAGLNGQPVSFSVINEMLPTTSPGPYTLRLYTDNPIIRLRATQSGTPGEASVDYNWLAVCQAGFTPPAPFGITGVTSVNCAAVTATERRLTFAPQYTGVSGQPISFSVINEMLPTTSPGPYTLRLYTDNPIIRLRATQSGTPGEASFNYNWLANCMGLGVARLGTSPEPTASLQVKLLGNPVHHAVEVEVTGSENTPLFLSLTDMSGRIIDQRRTEQAGASEHYLFDVSKLPPGSLLLRTRNQGQSQTVRILKVN